MKAKTIRRFANILICTFLCFTFFSCTNENKENDQGTKIDLTDDTFQPKLILLSEIADSLTYIKLETNDQTLISEITLACFSKNFLLIFDEREQKLLLFNRNGKFLNKIGNKGKGPGEFIRVFHIFISENENMIHVFADNQILQFSIDGHFIKQIPIPSGIYPKCVFPAPNETFFLLLNYPNTLLADNYSLLQMTASGKIINRKMKLEIDGANINDYGGPSYNYFCNGKIYHWDYLSESITCIDSLFNLTTKCSLVYGKKHLPETVTRHGDDDRSILSGGYLLTSLLYTDNIIFLSGIDRLNRLAGVYFINSGKHYNARYNLDIMDVGIVNDLDGSAPFWPRGAIDTKHVYSVVSPSTIKTMMNNEFQIKFGYKSKEARQMVDSLLKDSDLLLENPWIVVVKLK